ncbi:hypothetical protein [Bacillus infantis]|uniref:hypothetical protein n=1 Tax=Bacillus infantis TaxID=324767 RepID=UPI003219F869
MIQAISKKIYVETPLFDGWGTIQFEDPNEFFGIQIKLDVPDPDGHSIKRVSKYDIVDPPDEKQVSESIFSQHSEMVGYAAINSHRLSKGEPYLLKPTEANTGAYCNFYDVQGETFMGCRRVSDFRDIAPYIPSEWVTAAIEEPPFEEAQEVNFIANKKGQLGFDF